MNIEGQVGMFDSGTVGRRLGIKSHECTSYFQLHKDVTFLSASDI